MNLAHLDSGVSTTLAVDALEFQLIDHQGKLVHSKPIDDSGHGSATLSILLKAADHSINRVFSYKVIDGGQSILRILIGLNELLDKPVKILNLSLGIKGYNPVFATLIEALVNQGVIIVAAIGNGRAGESCSPGNYRQVLSVGALTLDGKVSKGSGSYHTSKTENCLKPDIVANGEQLPALDREGNTIKVSGTSMACALVSGKLAAIWTNHPHLNREQLLSLVISQAERKTNHQRHRYRYGYFCENLSEIPQHTENKTQSIWRNEKEPREKYLDPRLKRQLSFLTPEKRHKAIFVFQDRITTSDLKTSVKKKLLSIYKKCSQKPESYQFIERGNILIINAPCQLLEYFINDNDVWIASAVDSDIF